MVVAFGGTASVTAGQEGSDAVRQLGFDNDKAELAYARPRPGRSSCLQTKSCSTLSKQEH